MPKRNNAHAPFDATAELQKTRVYLKVRHRKGRRYRSKLDQYRVELVELRKQGGSYLELKTWLGNSHGLTCHPTTVMRYLSKLPELDNHA